MVIHLSDLMNKFMENVVPNKVTKNIGNGWILVIDFNIIKENENLRIIYNKESKNLYLFWKTVSIGKIL